MFGRGELQLAILLETMRREGYEMAVTQPMVILKRLENGDLIEPVEEVCALQSSQNIAFLSYFV